MQEKAKVLAPGQRDLGVSIDWVLLVTNVTSPLGALDGGTGHKEGSVERLKPPSKISPTRPGPSGFLTPFWLTRESCL